MRRRVVLVGGVLTCAVVAKLGFAYFHHDPRRLLSPPTLVGEPRVGAGVSPSRGRWTGGRPGDFSLAGVRACRTRAAVDCRLLTTSVIQIGSPEAGVLGAGYKGWYIGAIEAWYAKETAFTAIGYPNAESSPRQGQPSPKPSATVAVGPLVGPVR